MYVRGRAGDVSCVGRVCVDRVCGDAEVASALRSVVAYSVTVAGLAVALPALYATALVLTPRPALLLIPFPSDEMSVVASTTSPSMPKLPFLAECLEQANPIVEQRWIAWDGGGRWWAMVDGGGQWWVNNKAGLPLALLLLLLRAGARFA